jgi:2,5-diamino-6-(ribosylamino)-4(3H)-pyrimidinone 5'-phosphate reductase
MGNEGHEDCILSTNRGGYIVTRPNMIIHNQLSLDGKYFGFEIDPGPYYALASKMGADAMLMGSETAIAVVRETPEEMPKDLQRPDPESKGDALLWFLIDSGGRIRHLHLFRRFEFCADVVVLVSESTPEEHLEYLRERDYDIIVAGSERVDLSKALDAIVEKYGIKTMRVDSGGVLCSLLLKEGLADEVSLVFSPVLIGSEDPHFFQTLRIEDGDIGLELRGCDALDGGLVHLSYVIK